MPVQGIDVSDYQGDVDWSAVAQSGRQFAFAKATEGTHFVCRTFPSNWAGIRAAGLVRGAYHFARPDRNSPEAEADFFLSQVGQLEPGDLLALDLEAGTGDLAAWACAWLQRVTDQVGVRPLLYSGTWFLVPHGCTENDDLARYGLWLAAYSAVHPAPPPGWGCLAFWQHTDRASVPGVDGPCDESFFLGDPAALELYGLNGATAGIDGSQPTPSTAAGSSTAPGAGDYVVRSGDTLSGIAQACGCSLDDLLAANPQITDPNLIMPGEVLHIPSAAQAPSSNGTQTYVVRGGDTLSGIASRLGVSLLALERANPQLDDPNLLMPGQMLAVPAA